MNEIDRRQLLRSGATALGLSVAGVAMIDVHAADARSVNDSTKRSYGPVGIIGDSISGGYLDGLTKSLRSGGVGPFRYDIRGSRRITKADSGVAAIKSMKAKGFTPKAWVVALGNNDFYFFRRDLQNPRTEVETLLRACGAGAKVAWPTIWSKDSYCAKFNAGLSAAAAANPGLLVVDWASTAKAHPEWLASDGAHLTLAGAKARNDMLVRAAIRACKAAGAVQ